jgi:ribose transport system substrate-binding protein
MKIKSAILSIGILTLIIQTNGALAANTSKDRVFAMNVVVSGVPFWIEARNTWAKLPEKFPDIKTVFGGPLDTNTERQTEEMEALIAQKVSGIVIAPCDSKALTPVINKAVAAGIPVVTVLNDAPNSKRSSYITSELEASGEKIGDMMAAKAGNKGKVIVCYSQAWNEEQERRAKGIRTAITRNSNMKVVASIEDRFDENVGAEAIKTLLIQHKDVSVIAGCNSRSAIGAVIALKELGYKPGQVVVSGWDFDNDLLHLIKQGWVQGSVAQNSEFITFLAYSILQSTDLQLPNIKGEHRFFPHTIVVPTTIVTEKNYADFLRQ